MTALYESKKGDRSLIQFDSKESADSPLNSNTDKRQFEDVNIRCIDCGEDFIWTAGEQTFFYDKGLQNPPKRCKPCKQAKNDRIASIAAAQAAGIKQKIEVSVDCAGCGVRTTVPFYPSQGRPVFCRSCFDSGKNKENQPPT